MVNQTPDEGCLSRATTGSDGSLFAFNRDKGSSSTSSSAYSVFSEVSVLNPSFSSGFRSPALAPLNSAGKC